MSIKLVDMNWVVLDIENKHPRSKERGLLVCTKIIYKQGMPPLLPTPVGGYNTKNIHL